MLHDRIEDYRQTFERLFIQDEDMLNRLGQIHYPIPKTLAAAASASLDLHLRQAIGRLEHDGDLTRIRSLCDRGTAWGYQPEHAFLAKALSEALQRTISRLDPEADFATLTAPVELLLDASSLLGISPDLWQAQNHLVDASVRLSDLGVMGDPLRAVFANLASRLRISHDLLGWRP